MDCHKEQLTAQMAHMIVRKSRKKRNHIDRNDRITFAYKCEFCGHYHTTSTRQNYKSKLKSKWVENKKNKLAMKQLQQLKSR